MRAATYITRNLEYIRGYLKVFCTNSNGSMSLGKISNEVHSFCVIKMIERK